MKDREGGEGRGGEEGSEIGLFASCVSSKSCDYALQQIEACVTPQSQTVIVARGLVCESWLSKVVVIA
jgi:hypothetical protein